MPLPEILLRATAWASLVAWVASEWTFGIEKATPRARARGAFTAGLLALLVHTGLALHIRHSWDQGDAFREIARQTVEVTGIAFGGGLVFNYVFLAFWAGEAFLWWGRPSLYEHRSVAGRRISRAVFFFMFVNAAVVFGHGPIRVVGALLLLIVLASWYRGRGQEGARD